MYVRWAELGLGVSVDGVSADRMADMLRAVLRNGLVRAVVDANDPFAEGVSPLLETVCVDLGIPHVRLAPTSFEQLHDASQWHWVDSLTEAADAAWHGANTPVVALEPLALCAGLVEADGRKAVCHRRFSVADGPRPHWLREPERPVHSPSQATRLLDDEAATVLMTNDSGDPRVLQLLEVSGLRPLEVVMMRRPPRWRGLGGASAVVHDVGQALKWRNAVL